MKLTLEHLNIFVNTVRTVNQECEKHSTFSINSSELFSHLEKAIDIILTAYFGTYNTNIIWEYIYGNSQFSNTAELYEYLNDEHSELVSDDNPLTVDQLIDKFPKDKMFEFFKQFINDNS